MGQDLLRFYIASNRLYLQSVRGHLPDWIADYFDRGRPESVVEYGRMNRFRSQLPQVIRPDLLLTEQGWVATELDSVPGGIGLTAALARLYGELGYRLAGGPAGMLEGFAAMLAAAAGQPAPPTAIVVSDESLDYLGEMQWLAEALAEQGLPVATVRPEEVCFTEEALLAPAATTRLPGQDPPLRPVQVVYRFFELFDLKNIPKAELILYAAKKRRVVLTPPPKSYLEEKLLFALLHHPLLEDFWARELGAGTVGRLRTLFPQTWVLDPRPLPPHATIPGLTVGGRPVQSWEQLKTLHGRPLTQKERRFVLKPSGFSELAWGSRGVVVGHDVPAEEWAAAVDQALAAFPHTRYILQGFQHVVRSQASYYDFQAGALRSFSGRARLCPYFFVVGEEVRLGGVLATVVPPDKKLIHGMVDAVMVPCGVQDTGP